MVQRGDGFTQLAKMTTLELIGLFLPLLTILVTVRGKNIVIGVDNVSVVFAWENGTVVGDMDASALIRTLSITAAYLECRVFVKHIPRLTLLSTYMVDSLTRQSTATADVWSAMVGVASYEPPGVLWDWLKEPRVDWDLGMRIVDSLKQ
jgi:hypothetical protein